MLPLYLDNLVQPTPKLGQTQNGEEGDESAKGWNGIKPLYHKSKQRYSEIFRIIQFQRLAHESLTNSPKDMPVHFLFFYFFAFKPQFWTITIAVKVFHPGPKRFPFLAVHAYFKCAPNGITGKRCGSVSSSLWLNSFSDVQMWKHIKRLDINEESHSDFLESYHWKNNRWRGGSLLLITQLSWFMNNYK